MKSDVQRSVNGGLVHINEVVVNLIRAGQQRMKIALMETRSKSLVRLEVIYKEMIKSHRMEKITKVSNQSTEMAEKIVVAFNDDPIIESC